MAFTFPFPTNGDETWYDYATALDDEVRNLGQTYYTKEEVEALIAAAIGAGPQDPDPTPISPYKPRDVLNLGTGAGKNHYYLQMAELGASSYTAVSLPELVGGYEKNPYFYTITDGSGIERVHMQVQAGAPTTSGSSAPRCELREMDESGANIAFAPATGTHRQQLKTTIMAAPASSPEVVIGQLHSGNRDRLAIRTQAIASANPSVVALAIRVNGSLGDKSGINGNGWQEATAFSGMGTREIPWKMECIGGIWRVYIDDMTTPKVTVAHSILQASETSSVVTASSWYFKKGVYAQRSPSTTPPVGATEIFSARVRDSQHFHTGWTTPQAFPVLA